MSRKSWPKCQASMVEGATLDSKDGGQSISRWLEGAPVKGWFGLKMKGKKLISIQTFRCPRCCYLESYAPE